MNQALFDYIAACPTAYQAVAHTEEILKGKGYLPLYENEEWALEKGKGYYVTRNGSSLIAFRIPKEAKTGFMITASHCDSPSFKIKENAEIKEGGYVRLSVEKYGGMLCSTWLDKPLSVAGRITVKSGHGIRLCNVDLQKTAVVIPNVAIHMNRNANENTSYNPAVDMLPLYGLEKSFRAEIAAAAGVKEEDILTSDLFLYNPQAGVEWGEYISSPRLDDLQCAFSALTAFLMAQKDGGMPVYCLFDNEEVGSQTKQGAASTFLFDTLERIAENSGMGGTYRRLLADSFMLSCDNAHAVHPNHPEYSDKNHTCRMNGGVVVKYNANQKYTTDALSAGVFARICEKAGVPTQMYANRADMPGGSTLGNISNTQVSLNTADIGLAQLAMHSAFETAGAKDTEYMVKALKAFYETSVHIKGQEVVLQ
jgi:aspartyl aminopeptidase